MRNLFLSSLVIGLIAWIVVQSPASAAHQSLAAISFTSTIPQDDETDKTKADDEDDDETEEKELTLERLFPKKSFFGPSASGMTISHDGRYGLYRYRPYIERRHGSDLWLYDFEIGEAKRLTSVTVMAPFQESTRKVRDDRVKKAKKKGKRKKPGEKKTNGTLLDVSGVYEGVVTGPEDIGLPPEGLPFTATLRIYSDGTAQGRFETTAASGDITDGAYDAETGELTGTISGGEGAMRATLAAAIDGESISGDITLGAFGITVKLEGERTGDLEEDESSDAEEDDNEGEEGEDGEGDSDEDKEVDDGDDQDLELGDVVDDKDADDSKSPRYSGIQTAVWAPEKNEFIFVSQGDLYEYAVESGEITRLTNTKQFEGSVQYLPDGSGYTYLQNNALIRVTYGSHILDQVDPDLPGGETMSGYRLSPDGKRVVFLTSRGRSAFSGAGRTVKIVNYRNRFAEVREVPRTVSDDTIPDFHWSVYLYEINDPLAEEGKLAKVFGHKQSGPRDIMRVADWAPDSSRVTFAVFEQTSGEVQILEARFPEPEEPEAEDDDEEEAEPENGADNDDDADDDEDGDKDEADDNEDDDEPDFEDARVVYRFLHNGGPNTPGMIRPQYLWDSRRIVFITEQSGFRNLHVLDPLYESLEQITRGHHEVYPFGMSDDHRTLFATSTKEHPSQAQVYAINLEDGEMTKLTDEPGVYSSVAVSNDAAHILANHISYGRLRELIVIDADDDSHAVLTDSHTEEAAKLTEPVPEFFTYKNRHGHEIHGQMFKPDDWTAEDKRPLLIYVYGGPLGTRKMVTDGSYSSDSYFFAYYMAKKHGYVTCTIDPRGASGYGGLFEKSNFEQVGKPQVEDLVDGAKWFIKNQGVDKKRVAIHGWSFGGFQTQMCLYTEPDVFACGMAGAGPTEWENYNSWYSTGTIGKSREGKTDLKEFSLLPLAKNLKAKLLLVHGMEDSNVLYQDTVRVYRELLKADKETLVELFLDPTGGHGLGGDIKRINRMRKYEEFLLRCVGTGNAEEEEPEEGTGDDAGR